MAIEYSLKLSGAISKANIRDLLLGELPSLEKDEKSAGQAIIFALNSKLLRITAIRSESRFPDLLGGDGATNMTIMFRVRDKDRINEAFTLVLTCVGGFVQHTNNDLVLLFNGDAPILFRSAGRVVLNADKELGFWDVPGRVEAIGVPHQMAFL